MVYERNHAGDPFASQGYWTPQTSQANFCEEDYAVSIYIAEFINSLTNLAYVYYSIKTLRNPSLRNLITTTPNLALFSIGVTSLIFHMTLKHTTQLGDDLSMFWFAAAIIYQLYTPNFDTKSKVLFAAGLVGTLLVISYFHIFYDVLWLHTSTFAVLLTAIWPRVLQLIAKQLHGEEKREAMKKFHWGGRAFLLGFGLWLVDCSMCGQLRELRKQIGLPWAWLLELHGWWHILTSIGAARFVELSESLTRKEIWSRTEEKKKA